eukprot:3496202-Alexandrium_andersonii.AAC.1
MSASLVGSEMCIRDSALRGPFRLSERSGSFLSCVPCPFIQKATWMLDASCCHVGFETPRGLRAPFLPGPCLLAQATRRPQVYRAVGAATSSARRPCCMSE